MDNLLHSPFIVPLGAFAMVAIIVSVSAWAKARHRELDVQHDLRLREMEHLQKMKELEIERLKVGKGPEA
jgi:hypothetical protein